MGTKGYKHSEETLLRMSLSQKERWNPEERLAMHMANGSGEKTIEDFSKMIRPVSDETKRKISDAWTDERRKSLSDRMKSHNVKKQFCIHGHDTNVRGRTPRGQCRECAKRIGRKANWGRDNIVNSEGNSFSHVDYDRAYQIQSGCCKICGTHQSELRAPLYVDHNHETKMFRGLLCNNCNAAIGLLGDNAETMEKATDYIKIHGGVL